jgi:catechol 2,3-dioxygenase-like lactoylglutathione lyase family enzyme
MPQLNAIGIIANDLERSIRFYRLLGLDVPETPDAPHIDTFLPSGLRFMLDSEQHMAEVEGDWQRVNGNQIALAFECASPAEVDETHRRAVDAGFDGYKEPWDAFWGQRYAQLRDPDGVVIDLYAAL